MFWVVTVSVRSTGRRVCVICDPAHLPLSPPAGLQVYTLGASVTRGLGASRPEHNYANRFFSLINATFPHK